MKNILPLMLLIGSTFSSKAQEGEAYLFQTINAKGYQNASFRLEGQFFFLGRRVSAAASCTKELSCGTLRNIIL